MHEQMCFLQAVAKLMDREGIRCYFDCLPSLDRDFWDRILEEQKTEDRRTLEEIAALLRENTSEFRCIDGIIILLEGRGFNTIPRHDF